MKKILFIVLILLLSISLFGCYEITQDNRSKKEEQQKQKIVKNVVENFASKLQMVSLLAPKDVLENSMKENYGDFVTETLLQEWINNPQNALGRLTSSPWPDRIEILNIKKLSEDEYEVNGEIIEITSEEKASNGAAIKRPITLNVKNIDNKWLISDVVLGEYNKPLTDDTQQKASELKPSAFFPFELEYVGVSRVR